MFHFSLCHLEKARPLLKRNEFNHERAGSIKYLLDTETFSPVSDEHWRLPQGHSSKTSELKLEVLHDSDGERFSHRNGC